MRRTVSVSILPIAGRRRMRPDCDAIEFDVDLRTWQLLVGGYKARRRRYNETEDALRGVIVMSMLAVQR